jgi:hypothetical protein
MSYICVSSSTGSDGSGVRGTLAAAAAAPYKTAAGAEAVAQAGDIVAFLCGDTWREEVTLGVSGTAGAWVLCTGYRLVGGTPVIDASGANTPPRLTGMDTHPLCLVGDVINDSFEAGISASWTTSAAVAQCTWGAGGGVPATGPSGGGTKGASIPSNYGLHKTLGAGTLEVWAECDSYCPNSGQNRILQFKDDAGNALAFAYWDGTDLYAMATGGSYNYAAGAAATWFGVRLRVVLNPVNGYCIVDVWKRADGGTYAAAPNFRVTSSGHAAARTISDAIFGNATYVSAGTTYQDRCRVGYTPAAPAGLYAGTFLGATPLDGLPGTTTGQHHLRLTVGGADAGQMAASLAAVNAAGAWWYGADEVLYTYNNTTAAVVELSTRETVFKGAGKSFRAFEGLQLDGGRQGPLQVIGASGTTKGLRVRHCLLKHGTYINLWASGIDGVEVTDNDLGWCGHVLALFNSELTGGTYTPCRGVVTARNVCHDWEREALTATGVDGWFAWGNAFYRGRQERNGGQTPPTLFISDGAGDRTGGSTLGVTGLVHWHHNTAYDVAGPGFSFSSDNPGLTEVVIEDNIGISISAALAPFYASAASGRFRLARNLWHNTAAGPAAFLGATGYATAAALDAALGYDSGTLTGDPGFLDPANADFHVPADSLAVESGAGLAGGLTTRGAYPLRHAEVLAEERATLELLLGFLAGKNNAYDPTTGIYAINDRNGTPLATLHLTGSGSHGDLTIL